MASLRSLLRSLGTLGTAGATANARAELDARTREEWLVAGLERRVDRAAAAAAVTRDRLAGPQADRHRTDDRRHDARAVRRSA